MHALAGQPALSQNTSTVYVKLAVISAKLPTLEEKAHRYLTQGEKSPTCNIKYKPIGLRSTEAMLRHMPCRKTKHNCMVVRSIFTSIVKELKGSQQQQLIAAMHTHSTRERHQTLHYRSSCNDNHLCHAERTWKNAQLCPAALATSSLLGATRVRLLALCSEWAALQSDAEWKLGARQQKAWYLRYLLRQSKQTAYISCVHHDLPSQGTWKCKHKGRFLGIHCAGRQHAFWHYSITCSVFTSDQHHGVASKVRMSPMKLKV